MALVLPAFRHNRELLMSSCVCVCIRERESVWVWGRCMHVYVGAHILVHDGFWFILRLWSTLGQEQNKRKTDIISSWKEAIDRSLSRLQGCKSEEENSYFWTFFICLNLREGRTCFPWCCKVGYIILKWLIWMLSPNSDVKNSF